MSQDVVDDLHAAEDQIETWRSATIEALCHDQGGQLRMRAADRARLVSLAADPYCRPTCGAQGSPNREACDGGDDCGCPCHPAVT